MAQVDTPLAQNSFSLGMSNFLEEAPVQIITVEAAYFFPEAMISKEFFKTLKESALATGLFFWKSVELKNSRLDKSKCKAKDVKSKNLGYMRK